jgi:hypothetical protein
MDNFHKEEFPKGVISELPSFDSPDWHEYNTAIESKKTTSIWDRFGPTTYRLYTYQNSPEFIAIGG